MIVKVVFTILTKDTHDLAIIFYIKIKMKYKINFSLWFFFFKISNKLIYTFAYINYFNKIYFYEVDKSRKILISKYEYVFVEFQNPISNWKCKNNNTMFKINTENYRKSNAYCVNLTADSYDSLIL